jgi:hypothetical protein
MAGLLFRPREWEEVTTATIIPSQFKNEDAVLQRSAELQAEFERPADIASPPPALRDTFLRYAFAEGRAINSDTGKAQVTWVPRTSSLEPTGLITSERQRTLGGVISTPDAGSKVAAKFFLGGVAVFENEDSDEVSQRHGAEFTFANMPNMKSYGPDSGLHDIGYDMQVVDGICFVDGK